MDHFSGETRQHPMVVCAESIHDALDAVAEVDPAWMATADKARVLTELSRAEARLEGLRGRVLATADDVAEEDGARNITVWLAQRAVDDYGTIRALVARAEALAGRYRHVEDALCAGTINAAAAKVIARGLDDLPDYVTDQVREKAELTLVDEAARFRPKDLRLLARKILEVVAPDEYDAQERAALEQQERRAHERIKLNLWPSGNGITKLTGYLPDPVAEMLKTYLEAYSAPRKLLPLGEDRLSYPERLGHAFCDLLTSLPGEVLPIHGGTATSVVVTMTLKDLLGDGVATLGTHNRITAGEARRLACQAGIIPVVLGGKSEILDLGRTRRLFNNPQRKAMAIRDRVCRAEGCDIPAAWCEAHHLDPWSRGGRTDLADGVLACSHHHHLFHDPAYDASRLPNGDYRFHRRT